MTTGADERVAILLRQWGREVRLAQIAGPGARFKNQDLCRYWRDRWPELPTGRSPGWVEFAADELSEVPWATQAPETVSVYRRRTWDNAHLAAHYSVPCAQIAERVPNGQLPGL